MIGMRAFILVEPYGPLDFTICNTITEAVTKVAAYREQGKNTRLFETSGTIADLRTQQQALRAEYVAHLAETLPAVAS